MRRTLVPPEITRMIGACQLSRNSAVRIFATLHDELPRRYSQFRHQRHPDDDRLFQFLVAVSDGALVHAFTFFVDDTTSTEHLIVSDVDYEAIREP